MKWRAQKDVSDSQVFEIKRISSFGFYFYVFEDGKCIYDYLQDTFEIAMECAWEDFGVPKDAWKKDDYPH